MINEHWFDDRQALQDVLFELAVAAIQQDVTDQGQASLLLSGGSTPGPLYKRLAEQALPWEQVQVALVDERWVEPDHQASNERLLRNTLLCGPAASATFIPMKNSAATPFDGEQACNQAYEQLHLPASFCLLGMGPDAHTASLFPQAQGLSQALQSDARCAAIEAKQSAVTGEYTSRMSMTPAALCQSKKLVLWITGEEKRKVYLQAKQGGEDVSKPISVLLHSANAIDVYWAP